MNPLLETMGENPLAFFNEKDALGFESTTHHPSLEDHQNRLAQLAGQVAAEGFQSLHDIGLLIVEGLEFLSQDTVPPDLWVELAGLPEAFSEYTFGVEASIPNIVQILRHPSLQIPLNEDKLTLLANQLVSELAAQNLLGEENLESDDFFGDLDFNADLTTSEPSKEILELVELLEMEAALISRLLSAINMDAPENMRGQLEIISDNLERYENAANMAEFFGLAMICGQVNANVRAFYAASGQFTADQRDALQTWISNVNDYLGNFNEMGAGLHMLQQLGDTAWALPISLETAAAILAKLQSTDTDAATGEVISRPLTATAGDVSLTVPDDVNQELLTILLQELPVQTQVFSAAVQALQTGGSLGDLETAQRTAHNVKGAANTVGIKAIAQLTHSLEDILVACAQHQKLPGQELLNTLIDAADCLEAMSESLNGLAPPPDEALAVLQNVLDWANRIDAEGIGAIDTAAAQTQDAVADPQITGQEATEAATEKPQTTMVRIAAEQLEDFFRQAGENIILNSQANERLRRMKNHLQALEAQFDLLRKLGDELDQLIDLKDLSGRSLANAASHFDALEMDQYNELHTASRRMVEAAFDARELKLDASRELEAMAKLLEEHYRMATETQESIIKTCLVPVALLAPRLERSLRQTCRLTGKQCDLELSGDTLTVDSIIDPLLHILRNAVDHGIESAESRLAAGKPERGRIHIGFAREGNHAVVHVRDDGRGLDYAAIRHAAEQRGVISPTQTVTQDDLKRLILRPNFSTRSHITQTSGRGVGMDVVNHQVLAQGGTLTLHSVTGQGLSVELKIPLPLSRSHALLTQIGNYRLALSNKGILKLLFVDAHALSEDGQWLTVDGSTYPAIPLNKLLDIAAYHKSGQASQTALLVQNNDQLTAVVLDVITDSQDIVIKKMGSHIKKMQGFMGAAMMGDGTVAPVLDLPELLRAVGDADSHWGDVENPEPLPISLLPKVLVVDDSLSQRRALEQLLQDAGFQVSTARDGVEAAEQLATDLPDIVLTDLEMPRMNGIELTAHIRTRENLKALPVIMITSRTTEAHRRIAEDVGIDRYLVKPVREDDLLAHIQQLLEDTVAAE